MRVDKFLWFARLARTRSEAQTIAASGHLRIDGRRVERAHALIRAGQVITFVRQDCVHIVRLRDLPVRRGPAPEARGCYTDLSPIVDGTAVQS